MNYHPARFVQALLQVAFLALLSLGPAATAWGLADRDLNPVQQVLAKDDLVEAHRLLERLAATNPQDADVHVLLGEVHWRKGDLRGARESFEKARTVSPKDARALAGLALVGLAEDNLQAAEPLARQAVDLDKKLWLGNFALGRVLLAKGDIEGAFASFEKGKDTKGREQGRDLFESAMGLIGLAEKDLEGAETSLIRARALAPNTVEHVMNLADLYESTDQWGQAAVVLEDMEKKLGGTPQVSFRLGRAYEKLRRWNDAFRQYQVSLQADSTYAPSLAALGHLYLLDSSKTAAAVTVLTRAVEIRPTAASRLDLGIALTRVNRAGEAVPHLEAALAETPTPPSKLALARAYLKADMNDKGLALIDGDPDVRAEAAASDLVLAAAAAIQAKDFAKARKYLDGAEEKDPELSDIAYRRGQIQMHEKDYAGAIAFFQKKLEKDPQSAAAWLHLGLSQQGNGDPRAAAASFRKMTEVAPQSAAGWVHLGGVLTEIGSQAEAKTAYDRALQIDPNSAPARRGRGYLLLVEKRYPEAVADLRRATELDPKNGDGWTWLGQAMLNSGNRQEARGAFEKALAIDPNNTSAQEGLALIAEATR